MWSGECDQVFWVRLDVIEDYKDGCIGAVICHTVVQVCNIAGALGGGGDHALYSLGEVSHQDLGQVHALVLLAVRFSVAMWVFRAHSKVGTIAVQPTYCTKQRKKTWTFTNLQAKRHPVKQMDKIYLNIFNINIILLKRTKKK